MNEAQLRELYGRALADRDGGRREGCITPVQLQALAERSVSASDRLGLLDHVTACEACRREYALLDALVEAEKPALRSRFAVPLAAAAAVLLVVSAGLLWSTIRGRGGPEGSLRGRPGEPQLLEPVGVVPSRPITFVWRPVPGAERYTLEVFTPAGDPVYTVQATDTTAGLPDSVKLTAGAVYHWWLLVRMPDGQETRTSPVEFRP